MAKRTNWAAWVLTAALARIACPGAVAQRSQIGPPQSPMEGWGAWGKVEDAILCGDARSARRYALQMLREADPKFLSYGDVVHEANQILGLAALQEGNTKEAKEYLLAAGRTRGSPLLDSYGPSMELAQKLLARGEREVVTEYLDLVARFWATTPESKLREFEKKRPGSAALARKMDSEHRRRIDEWKKEIRAGKQPELNVAG